MYLVGFYLVAIVILGQNWVLFKAGFALWFLMFMVLYLGAFIGFLGIIFQGMFKQPKLATHLYKLSILLKTTNAPTLASYGLYLLREGDPATAKKLFERGIQYNKNYVIERSLQANLGLSYWKLNNPEKAIEIYENLLVQFSETAQEELLALKESQYDLAILETFTANRKDFTMQDYVTLGYMQLLINNTPAATFYSQAALVLKTDYAPALDNLGQIAFHQNDLQTARTLFEQALALKPTLPDSLYYMTRIELAAQNKDLAKSYFQRLKQSKLDGLSTVTVEMVNELQKQTVGI